MKSYITIVAALCGFLSNFSLVESTPSTVFWTPCTTTVEPYGYGHLDADSYFTVFNHHGHGEYFPPDIGLLLGVFKCGDFSMEAGIDYIGGTDKPLFFNAKIGLAENALFPCAPAINVGIFGVGTSNTGHERTNLNVVDLIFGKKLPEWLGGNIYVAGFTGSRALGKNRQGFMVAFDHSFCKTKDCDGTEYYKWVLVGDYASGKNKIGGGALGMYYYFRPGISILTGPVFFNTAQYNGRWKWSVQLDVDFPVFAKKK